MTATDLSTTASILGIESVDHFTVIQLAIAGMDAAMAARVFDECRFYNPRSQSAVAVRAAQNSLNEAVLAWFETVEITEPPDPDKVAYMLLDMLRSDRRKFEAYFASIYRVTQNWRNEGGYQGSLLYRGIAGRIPEDEDQA